MHRPGVELATSRSRVERPTTTLPSHPVAVLLYVAVGYLCTWSIDARNDTPVQVDAWMAVADAEAGDER